MNNGEILTVRELTYLLKSQIEREPQFRDVWLKAEISNFTNHSRGHMYFTLKDEYTRIRAVMFAGHNRYLKFMPKNGMKVLVRGEVNIYERDGQYQFYVREMQPDGLGALYQAYEQLKQKLERQGWFAPEVKKPIPKVPGRIGVITSKTGAAVRDILTTINRRFPIVEVIVFPVYVQGDYAPKSIARAIDLAHEEGGIDVLIVGRGGGSIEELWAFNEETVAAAIYRSSIPVISAVGHETDFTIADFVADLRAPTPTAAAELAVPVLAEMREKILQSRSSLRRSLLHLIEAKRNTLTSLQNSYAFRYPLLLVQQKEQELDQWMVRLERAFLQQKQDSSNQFQQRRRALLQQNPYHKLKQASLERARLTVQLKKEIDRYLCRSKEKLQWQITQLDAFSPLKIMTKGYSLLYNQNKDHLYRSVKEIEPGQALRVRMHDGELDCNVWGIKEEQNHE